MNTVESAGIILTRKNVLTGEQEVLLGHATHKNPPSKEDNRWTLLKGKLEKSETLWQAAKREFFEESNFLINDNKIVSVAVDKQGKPAPWASYSLKSSVDGVPVRKTVQVFWLIDEIGLTQNFDFKCNTTIGGRGDYMEIDGYTWASPSAAEKMCMPSQRTVFEHLRIVTNNLI